MDIIKRLDLRLRRVMSHLISELDVIIEQSDITNENSFAYTYTEYPDDAKDEHESFNDQIAVLANDRRNAEKYEKLISIYKEWRQLAQEIKETFD